VLSYRSVSMYLWPLGIYSLSRDRVGEGYGKESARTQVEGTIPGFAWYHWGKT